jgi:hypothetical protein
MDKIGIVAIILAAIVVLVVVLGNLALARNKRTVKRARFIADYVIPAALGPKILKLHPGLTHEQLALVLKGLRQYFLACLSAQQRGGLARYVGMPSRAVDDAWHEFILMTPEYTKFCANAFGRYLHHSPEEHMKEPIGSALANTLDQLRGRAPLRGGWAMLGAVPLLFAIDRELQLSDGHRYEVGDLDALDRERHRQSAHTSGGGAACGGSVGTSSHCGPSGGCDAGSAASCGGGSCGGGGGGCGSS